MGSVRRIARICRAVLLVLCGILLCLIASIQIEQHVLRRRSERLLRDVRSLQIHRSTFSDVQALGRRWGKFTNWSGVCTPESCGFEIGWSDFSIRHSRFVNRLNMLHEFVLAGGRAQGVFAEVQMEGGILTANHFHVSVDAPATEDSGQWSDYWLIGSVGLDPNFLARYRLPPEHPPYAVGMPSGCEGCKDIYVVFDPSVDAATVDRLTQFDLSCLTRWIHPCRDEADIMPNAWAQLELDRQSAKQ